MLFFQFNFVYFVPICATNTNYISEFPKSHFMCRILSHPRNGNLDEKSRPDHVAGCEAGVVSLELG